MTDDDIDLGTLRTPERPLPWAPAAEVRRRGAARRRRRKTMLGVGGAGLVAAATVVALTVSLSASPHHARRPVRSPEAIATDLRVGDRSGGAVELVANARSAAAPSNSAESAVARTEADFAVRLLRKLQGDASKNVLVSPSSLSNALAMLNYGARGRTQDQIAALLGPKGSSADTIAHGWASLVADWAKAAGADKITLSSANSVWLQHGAPLVKSFTDALAAYFDSGVWQVDFAADPAGAARDLDAWVSQQTHGKIPELLTKDDVNGLLLVLVNAVYFNADWTAPFSDSGKIRFTTAKGDVKDVDSMSRSAETATAVASNDRIDAAQVLYGSGRFAALLIEPKKQSLVHYVDSLGVDGLTAVARQLNFAPAEISLPTLSLKSSMDLKQVLKSLGMNDAFSQHQADLTGISPLADYIEFVNQKATLDVTRIGTTATAATAIGGLATSGRPLQTLTLTFDHPFLFVIRDVQTGAVLFTAEINDPTAH